MLSMFVVMATVLAMDLHMVITVIVHYSRYVNMINVRDIYSCVTNRDKLPSALNEESIFVADQSLDFCV